MRYRVEFASDLFQRVGLTIDNRFQQADQDMGAAGMNIGVAAAFLGESLEDRVGRKTHRQQLLGGKHEARRHAARPIVGSQDQGHAEVKIAATGREPGRCFDLAGAGFGGNGEPGGSGHGGGFFRGRADQIDPNCGL